MIERWCRKENAASDSDRWALPVSLKGWKQRLTKGSEQPRIVVKGWIRMAGLAFSVHKFTCHDLPVYVAFAFLKYYITSFVDTRGWIRRSVLTAAGLGPFGFSRCKHSRRKGAKLLLVWFATPVLLLLCKAFCVNDFPINLCHSSILRGDLEDEWMLLRKLCTYWGPLFFSKKVCHHGHIFVKKIQEGPREQK